MKAHDPTGAGSQMYILKTFSLPVGVSLYIYISFLFTNLLNSNIGRKEKRKGDDTPANSVIKTEIDHLKKEVQKQK